MDIALMPGRYVVAVSGGVDSMALLDLLRRKPDLQLTVAHFDHGIREESIEDRRLVESVARSHGLPFVYAEGHLGPGASEAEARKARYDFLRRVKRATNAAAIVTAHHQDDLLETAILNILRGTGRKGLSPLVSMQDIRRPLLHIPKQHLIRHARDNQLVWYEDQTNQDPAYTRNYVRNNIVPRLQVEHRNQLLDLAKRQAEINREIDTLLVNYLHMQEHRDVLDRRWFANLPHGVAREVLAGWLRSHELRDFDRKALERLVVGAKVSAPGKALDVIRSHQLLISSKYLELQRPNR